MKVASQATAVSRTTNDPAILFDLNKTEYSSNHGDLQQINFFGAYNYQWPDQLCQWWSAEPYAHLYPDTARAYDLLATGPMVIQSVGTAAGVATVAGVGAYRTGQPKSGFGAQKKARRHNR